MIVPNLSDLEIYFDGCEFTASLPSGSKIESLRALGVARAFWAGMRMQEQKLKRLKLDIPEMSREFAGTLDKFLHSQVRYTGKSGIHLTIHYEVLFRGVAAPPGHEPPPHSGVE